jgi:hypothetical protein
MRNKTEEKWNKMQGKLFHIQIRDVQTISYDGGIGLRIAAEIIEIGEYFKFEVDTTED